MGECRAVGFITVRATIVLIAVNVAVYGVMVANGSIDRSGDFTRTTLIAYGGLTSALFRQGEWWRLLTATFVHASASHLVWNMISLAFLGRFLEPRYAPARFLVVYFVGGLVSSAATVAWLWDSPAVAIGASGAISALIGAGAVSAFRMGRLGREFRNSMLTWAGMVLINGVIYHANNVAHGTGLLSGALLVLTFGRRGLAALTPREHVAGALGELDFVACASCGTVNPRGSRYCGSCGAALVPAVTQS